MLDQVVSEGLVTIVFLAQLLLLEVGVEETMLQVALG